MRPPWADEVIEVSRKEGFALMEAGVEVRVDWTYEDDDYWNYYPESGEVLWSGYQHCDCSFYYLLKDGTL